MRKQTKEKRFKAVGAKVKALRLKAGYTSYETFAFEHNLARKSYWEWERGTNYKLSTLIRIIDIHGLTMEEFFKDIK